MTKFELEKGLTPAAGAILLIAMTVSAAAILFGMFQGLAGGSHRIDSKYISNTEIKPLSAAENDGDIILSVKNTGSTTFNTSMLELRIKTEEEGSSLSYKKFSQLKPERVDLKPVFRFEQGDEKFFINPYKGTQTGKEWYPDTNQLGTADSPLVNALSSFAVLLYKNNDTGNEYLVLNNQNSNETVPSGENGFAKFNLYNIPPGTSVNYSDGKNGEGPGGRSSSGPDELQLNVEPEAYWGWDTNPNCCYDGGVLKLPDGWENISLRQLDTNMKKLQLYEKGNGSIEIDQYEPITIRRIAGNQCFDAAIKSEKLDPGEGYVCNTGLKMPEEEDMILVVNVKGYNKKWAYRCGPSENSRVC